jgi:hypothetical protein
MGFLRRNRVFLTFGGLLVLCTVLVLVQIQANQRRHTDLRDAFILLETKGYRTEALRLYQRLLNELENLPDGALLDDFERTLTLVNPAEHQVENLIWKYHWTVSNEMEKRTHTALDRALKMARDE